MHSPARRFRHSLPRLGIAVGLPEAKDGKLRTHPCELDTGNPCRYDVVFSLADDPTSLILASLDVIQWNQG